MGRVPILPSVLDDILAQWRRRGVAMLVVAAIASLVMALCNAVDPKGTLVLGWGTLGFFALATAILTAAFCLVCLIFTRARSRAGEGRHANHLAEKRGVEGRLDRRAIVICGIAIFACWLPWFIALYPVNFLGDTIISADWFVQWLGGANDVMSDHNPLFTVLLFGGIAWFGVHVLHDAGVAFFVFVLLQSALCALSFSLAVQHATQRLGVPRPLGRAALVFYALCPLFPVWNDFVSKDALFCPFFILWVVYLVEAVRTNGSFMSRRRLVEFVVITLIACLAKKLGFYVMVGSLVVVLVHEVVTRRHSEGGAWRACPVWLVSTILISAFVMMVALPYVVLPALQVEKGETYEFLSIQLQQTARYVVDNPDDVTDEERAAIDNLLGYDDLAQRYTWYLVDPVKYAISEPTDAYPAWARAYLAEGLRHPWSYFQAYVALEAGFGRVNLPMDVQLDSSFMSPYDYVPMPEAYTSQGVFVTLGEKAEAVFKWVEGLPVIGFLFCAPLYSLIVPLFFLGVAFTSRGESRRLLLPLCPVIILTCLGLWVSPISIWALGSRYLLPLIFVAPLLLLYAWRGCFDPAPVIHAEEG